MFVDLYCWGWFCGLLWLIVCWLGILCIWFALVVGCLLNFAGLWCFRLVIWHVDVIWMLIVLVIVDLVLDCVALFIGWGVLAFAGRCACDVVCCVAFLDVFVWVFWLLSLCFFCL